jgi:uncharacterized protein (TIGR02284 family)
MLLRDEKEMALNDVETLCAEAADHYAAAASRAQEAALVTLFGELAQHYRQFAAALAGHIRASGDLPQQPDPDREALVEVFTGIKGLLRGDPRSALIDEREQGEDAIAGAARDALAQDVQPDLHALLQEILAHTAAAKHRLGAARLAT